MPIAMDNAWLASNGGVYGPWFLNVANETYILGQDVSALTTAFVLLANGITLDLNGKTVTYNSAAPITIANNSFETQGAGGVGTADKWDFTNAVGASRFAGVYINNQVYDGSYSLRLTHTSGNQWVQHADLVTLTAGRTYALSGMFIYGNNGVTNPGMEGYATLDNAGTITKVGYALTANRGIQLVEAVYTPPGTAGTGVSHVLRVGANVLSGTITQPFYIDDIKISTHRSYGVLVGPKSYWPTDYPGITTYGSGNGCTIRNGSIVEAYPGSWCHGIHFAETQGGTVQNVAITVKGQNAHCLHGRSTGNYNFLITGNTFESQNKTISSRDSFNGAIVHGLPGTISSNTIVNGPHGGFICGGIPSNVQSNTVQLRSRYTNGYAILCSAGSTINNNTINNGSGQFTSRGIYTSGGNSTTITTISNNTISVQQLNDNQEYQGSNVFGAFGIQLENASFVNVFGNTVTANANVHKAYCLRINASPLGGYVHKNLNIYNNTFIANAVAAHAACMKIADLKRTDAGLPTNISIQNNTLRTNDGLLGETLWARFDLRNSMIELNLPTFSPQHVYSADFAVAPENHSDALFINNTYNNGPAQALIEGAVSQHYVNNVPDNRFTIAYQVEAAQVGVKQRRVGKWDTMTIRIPETAKRGDVLVIGEVVVIAADDVVAGEDGAVYCGSIFLFDKLLADSFGFGSTIYWDNTNKRPTATATGNKKLGSCVDQNAGVNAKTVLVLVG